MRKPLLLALLLLAAPAGATLTDDEVNNNAIGVAAIQIVPGGMPVVAEAGTLSLVAGDIDYVGIQGLVAGDIITVSTTPLDDIDFEDPDTIVGVFDDQGAMECIYDDAFNNELDAFAMGYGSLCRYKIIVPGDYYVGVTGYSPTAFDGTHTDVGDYGLTVTVLLPEPGLVLQLSVGLAGLAWLDRQRRRKVAA
jgi:hypothetical protein